MNSSEPNKRQADPRFVPTRYLSTRTAVRTARILRANVVYDWIMRVPNRPLRVRAHDFERLRLTLLLGGPSATQLQTALEREVDPRERRQLSICQTEQQIFARVLAAVVDHPPPAPSRTPPLPTINEVRALPLKRQVQICKELAQRPTDGVQGVESKQRLHAIIELLSHELVSKSLSASVSSLEPESALEELLELAGLLDETHPTTQCFAPILRTRALEMLEAQLEVVPTLRVGFVAELARPAVTFDNARNHSSERMARFGALLGLRKNLLEQGATPGPRSTQIWNRAAQLVLDELVHVWQLAFDALLASLRSAEPLQLNELLTRIQQPLLEMNVCGRRFVPLGHEPNCVAARVLGTKLMPFIDAALSATKPSTREAVAEAIELLLQRLDDAGASYAVSSTLLMAWAARALLATNETATPSTTPQARSYDGYRAFRASQASSSACHTLVAICTHIAQYSLELRAKHPPSLALVQAQLGELSPELVTTLCEVDERRIRTTLGFFEQWWNELTPSSSSAQEQLTNILGSRFYELLEQESVLLRFTLEAQLLGTLFPNCADVSRTLVAALSAFRDKVQNSVQVLTQVGGPNGRSPERTV